MPSPHVVWHPGIDGSYKSNLLILITTRLKGIINATSIILWNEISNVILKFQKYHFLCSTAWMTTVNPSPLIHTRSLYARLHPSPSPFISPSLHPLLSLLFFLYFTSSCPFYLPFPLYLPFPSPFFHFSLPFITKVFVDLFWTL